MNFLPRPKTGGKVVILGAGASFGADVEAAPPVMSAFVRTGRGIVKFNYAPLWTFLERIGYPLDNIESGNPNLEELYTVLQTISTGIWYASRDDYWGSVGEDFARMRPVDLLLSFIIEVLDVPSVSACRSQCSYHRKLFSQLQPGDTIISFNYDLIADTALRKEVYWDEAGGYGFGCLSRIKDLDSKGLFDTGMRCDVLLLKPHGSLNWRLQNEWLPSMVDDLPSRRSIRGELLGDRYGLDTRLRKRISLTAIEDITDHCYDYLPIEAFDLDSKLLGRMTEEEQRMFLSEGIRIHSDAFIVPPAAYKFGDVDIPPDIVEIWSLMSSALSTASRIVCVGYSFPLTDVEFGTLFRLSLSRKRRSDLEIEVVNPDQRVLERLRLMAPGIKIRHAAEFLADYTGSKL